MDNKRHLVIVKNPLMCVINYIQNKRMRQIVNRITFDQSRIEQKGKLVNPVSSPMFKCLTCVGFYCSVYRELSELFNEIDNGAPWLRNLIWNQLFVLVGKELRDDFSDPLRPYLDNNFNTAVIEPLEVEILFLSTFLVANSLGKAVTSDERPVGLPTDIADLGSLLSRSAHNFFGLYSKEIDEYCSSYIYNNNDDFLRRLASEATYKILTEWREDLNNLNNEQRETLYNTCGQARFLNQYRNGASFEYILDMFSNYEEHEEGINLLHQALHSLHERGVVSENFSPDNMVNMVNRIYGVDNLSASVVLNLAKNRRGMDANRSMSTPVFSKRSASAGIKFSTVGSVTARMSNLDISDDDYE